MKRYNIINFGYNPWSNFWKRNQTIFCYLSKERFVDKSYFINQPVWLFDIFRDPFGELKRPKLNNWSSVFPRKTKYFNGKVFTPLNLPLKDSFYPITKINGFLLASIARKISSTHNICLINTPSKFPLDFIKKYIFSDLIIFDWSDDFEKFTSDSSQRHAIRSVVENNIRSADIVLCVNDSLLERAKQINENSYLIKNATNYFEFSDAVDSKNIFESLDGPIIGYFGWINEERLDLDLLEYLAKVHSDCNFVFVGPKSHKGALDILTDKFRNIRIFPPVSYSKTPQVISRFDVCILPNKINEHTSGNDPIKLFDYLASGKPVVSTRTAALNTCLTVSISQTLTLNFPSTFQDRLMKVVRVKAEL